MEREEEEVKEKEEEEAEVSHTAPCLCSLGKEATNDPFFKVPDFSLVPQLEAQRRNT